MDAKDLTFGIEIETAMPASANLRIGRHGCGVQVPWLPEGWVADADPSIRPPVGYVQCEFVSPVFRGPEGLEQLIAAVNKIKSMGAKINDSCGIHVHVGFDRSNVKNVTKLTTLVANFEKAIYASTGTKKRERARWCNGMQRYGNAQQAIANSQQNRYHVLNLASRRPTVEFRAFASSLNTTKIVGHVLCCLGIVERSLKAKRVTNFTAKQPVESSPIARDGEGQTHLTRLFYQLGWIKGRTQETFGYFPSPSSPSLKQVKRQLMKLARKYDKSR